MEQDTVHLQIGNNNLYHLMFRGNRLLFIFLLPLILFISLLLTVSAASALEDNVLEQSGIKYPDGYDINTVGEVAGKAFNLVIPEKGPARFSLSSKREIYTVFASPGWYWNDLDIVFKDGSEIKVTGSKSLGKDGNLYIIAREIVVSDYNRSIVFRTNKGEAIWKSIGTGFSNKYGGFGSPGGARGGVTGSGGSGGRGRR
jgi:hypothetical protein